MVNTIKRLEYHDLEFGIDLQDNRKTLTGVGCGQICF